MAIEFVDRNEGEMVSVGPLMHRILEDGSHTGHRIGVVEVTLPPRTPGPPEHVHRQHDETFFVLSGNPTFTSGGKTITAQPGAMLTAPLGAPHSFANPGEEQAVFLATVTPDLYIDFFREIAKLGATPAALDPEVFSEVAARYATEVVQPTKR
jgi:quercetin dioxygenase-like cupin family protein